MSGTHIFPTYRGRIIGIVVLTASQFTIGIIHVFFGVLLLFAGSSFIVFLPPPSIYSIYTLGFGVLTLIFAYGIWRGNRWGWRGSVGVSIFVIIADALTLLNLPSIPGIPKFAGAAEIVYSLAVLLYLFQKHVRIKYNAPKLSAKATFDSL